MQNSFLIKTNDLKYTDSISPTIFLSLPPMSKNRPISKHNQKTLLLHSACTIFAIQKKEEA